MTLFVKCKLDPAAALTGGILLLIITVVEWGKVYLGLLH